MDYPTLFHLAIPVGNIPQTKAFYCDQLGAIAGRETAQALILNFFGHQLVAHTTEDPLLPPKSIYPRHFGIIFPTEDAWDGFNQRVLTHHLPYHIPPKRRFPDQLTDHWTCFLADPFHNLLEFKWYRHRESIFGIQPGAAIGDR